MHTISLALLAMLFALRSPARQSTSRTPGPVPTTRAKRLGAKILLALSIGLITIYTWSFFHAEMWVRLQAWYYDVFVVIPGIIILVPTVLFATVFLANTSTDVSQTKV